MVPNKAVTVTVQAEVDLTDPVDQGPQTCGQMRPTKGSNPAHGMNLQSAKSPQSRLSTPF